MTQSENAENVFYILHVEDEPQKVQYIREIAESVLKGRYNAGGVKWDDAASKEVAIEKLHSSQELRPKRGYDAVIVDIQLGQKGEVNRKENLAGLAVLKETMEVRDKYDWNGVTLCLSAFAYDTMVLSGREDLQGLVIHEWLHKNYEGVDHDLVTAKFSRCLIPVEQFAHDLARARGDAFPLVFENAQMKNLLRHVIFLARREYHSWPLARILLLGPPGCGKGALSKAFYRVLPNSKKAARAPFVKYNCASAVSEGHGGRIALFGARGFGAGVPDQPGVFERATQYKGSGGGLASVDAVPVIERAGVVFLDEFVELAPDLQASILNAVEEGEVRCEGDGSIVPICCHVVFATNQTPSSLVGSAGEGRAGRGRIRQDLIDRIPEILVIPPLDQRGGDEVDAIITAIAEAHLRRFNNNKPERVSISESAKKLIDRAISLNLLNSIRQLEAIANVLPHETRITDGNLRSLFEKAEVLGVTGLSDPPRKVSVRQQAKHLGLPEELQKNDLPEETNWAMSQLYAVFENSDKRMRGQDLIDRHSPNRWARIFLLVEVMGYGQYGKYFHPSGETIRRFRQRRLDRIGIDWKSREECVKYLLSSEDISSGRSGGLKE